MSLIILYSEDKVLQKC